MQGVQLRAKVGITRQELLKGTGYLFRRASRGTPTGLSSAGLTAELSQIARRLALIRDVRIAQPHSTQNQ